VREVALRFASEDPRVTLLEVSPRSSPSLARNVGAEKARGDILYFLDDDSVARPEGVRALAEYLESHTEVAVAGSATLTPPDDPLFSQVSGEVLASRWGAGFTRARFVRLSSHIAPGWHLITCNLALRRRLFEDGLRFPETFAGEEVILLEEARRRGHTFGYAEDAWVYHRRRRTLGAYLRQILRYGEGRALAIRREPTSFHPLFAIPLAFLAYLLLLPALSLLGVLAWAPLIAYAVITLLVSLARARAARSARLFALLPPVFLLTNIVYALGLLRGFLKGRRLGAPVPAVSSRA
jgi:cellulose synthase/poly-beta-1,6-N-acetylglucosamine synthase-like glycosyltransferase